MTPTSKVNEATSAIKTGVMTTTSVPTNRRMSPTASAPRANPASAPKIESVSDSIHYAGANCVANCESWNEHQKQKQDQVEAMKSQLADQQKKLEDMQESARKQGFGSSVYEP